MDVCINFISYLTNTVRKALRQQYQLRQNKVAPKVFCCFLSNHLEF